MSHLILAPLLVPLAAGALLLLAERASLYTRRVVSLGALVILLGVSFELLEVAGKGEIQVYLVGDWPAPFGIVLVLDRLAALLVTLTTVLGFASITHAIQGTDRGGPLFHALFQFQLLGLNGVFLTGDLFNLFVFFEILLISSYGLLLHGGGRQRTRAGLHYVVLNLLGSSLFLFAIAILYSVAGTLNMADLGQVLATLDPADAALARTGALLLLVVFALKAAVLPLHFWLPHAYGTATAPIAALFAIMTKVGVYAIVRVFGLFGHGDGPLADVAGPWIAGAALATMAAGTFGAMASRDLRQKVAYLVMISVGTLLIAVSLDSTAGLTGAVFYLIHTTLVTGALFLLTDLIAHGRPRGATITSDDERPAGSGPLAVLFFIASIAVIGMPPLSGLVGKLLILDAARSSPWAPWIWATVLLSGFMILVSLTRAGSDLFWRGGVSAERTAPAPHRLIPVGILLAASPLLVVFGGPLSELAQATAEQLSDTSGYIEAVLGQAPASARIPREVP
ncbi:formate hydrogenlyase subunit 3/multisubunit Na+/H+ antiporter, MnhD subunit [Thioflavicoccus mobilis 8321]|uniref:Formate hydrogenlyase subunit 3/multisubunit Na+/H+ antiporter, MnhD subunit n=1 Tax=Thioflavicoccus mobilis 8321 TaxID=765912 RepID=L0GYV8_9GAMM|nr:monovalent cation/H+ antiporter subunit D [Thioflavicoccus mobilis]AGA90560.1 formate hydrogenlyase subunit 3/multisubunit Na+/H+ antiporter, MnhD subunit [Thioflavicoccus mobilis 8321]